MANINAMMLDLYGAFISECMEAGFTQDADFDASRPDVQAIAVKYDDLIRMAEIGRMNGANVLRSMMWNVCVRLIKMHAAILEQESSK